MAHSNSALPRVYPKSTNRKRHRDRRHVIPPFRVHFPGRYVSSAERLRAHLVRAGYGVTLRPVRGGAR
jgi:hypothetical protein